MGRKVALSAVSFVRWTLPPCVATTIISRDEICSGDCLLLVGTKNVRWLSLPNIVSLIASGPRPLPLVFCPPHIDEAKVNDILHNHGVVPRPITGLRPGLPGDHSAADESVALRTFNFRSVITIYGKVGGINLKERGGRRTNARYASTLFEGWKTPPSAATSQLMSEQPVRAGDFLVQIGFEDVWKDVRKFRFEKIVSLIQNRPRPLTLVFYSPEVLLQDVEESIKMHDPNHFITKPLFPPAAVDPSPRNKPSTNKGGRPRKRKNALFESTQDCDMQCAPAAACSSPHITSGTTRIVRARVETAESAPDLVVPPGHAEEELTLRLDTSSEDEQDHPQEDQDIETWLPDTAAMPLLPMPSQVRAQPSFIPWVVAQANAPSPSSSPGARQALARLPPPPLPASGTSTPPTPHKSTRLSPPRSEAQSSICPAVLPSATIAPREESDSEYPPGASVRVLRNGVYHSAIIVRKLSMNRYDVRFTPASGIDDPSRPSIRIDAAFIQRPIVSSGSMKTTELRKLEKKRQFESLQMRISAARQKACRKSPQRMMGSSPSKSLSQPPPTPSPPQEITIPIQLAYLEEQLRIYSYRIPPNKVCDEFAAHLGVDTKSILHWFMSKRHERQPILDEMIV